MIAAKTHLHMSTEDGEKLNIKDSQLVDIYLKGAQKSGCLFDVMSRVGDSHATDLHIDTDEANTFQMGSDSKAVILVK